MNNPHHSLRVRRFRAVTVAVGCGVAGIGGVVLGQWITGSVAPAILILPVIVAAWFVGSALTTVTIAITSLAMLLVLAPGLKFSVTDSGDLARFVITVAVSVVVAVAVGRARRTHNRYRTIVESASDGIWLIDSEGRTTFVNDRMATLLGYAPAEMHQRRFSEFIPPDTVPIAESTFETRKQGIAQWDECQLLHRDGSTLWALYAATPILEGGEFTGALAVLTDITQRKLDEATIRQQTEELRRIDREKDQFLAMLSHELRNHLTPILTALGLMTLKSDDLFRRERAVIARQVDHLCRIVGDLLDVSRFLKASVPMRVDHVSVAEVVAAATEAVAPLIEEKHHRLTLNIPDGLTLTGDTQRLTQVMINLLTNATRYTPPGGHIALSGAVDGGDVILRVRDDGVGIAPSFLPSLFEPFTRHSGAAADSGIGLGLGLAIVRGIVSAHGGTVTAHSDGTGHGSEFVVRLPIISNTLSVPGQDQPARM